MGASLKARSTKKGMSASVKTIKKRAKLKKIARKEVNARGVISRLNVKKNLLPSAKKSRSPILYLPFRNMDVILQIMRGIVKQNMKTTLIGTIKHAHGRNFLSA